MDRDLALLTFFLIFLNVTAHMLRFVDLTTTNHAITITDPNGLNVFYSNNCAGSGGAVGCIVD